MGYERPDGEAVSYVTGWQDFIFAGYSAKMHVK